MITSALSSDISTLVANTLLTTLLALAIAAPIGILAALYLSELASPRVRRLLQPIVRTLAAVPPIVYAYFAITTLVPAFRERFSVVVIAGSALGMMMLPLVLSHAHIAASSVPQHLRDAAYALGGGKFSTAALVVVPAAKARLFAAVLLAASRAVGETMIVLAVNAAVFHPLQHQPTRTLATFMMAIDPDSARPGSPWFGKFCIVGALLLLLAFTLEFARASLGKPSAGDAP